MNFIRNMFVLFNVFYFNQKMVQSMSTFRPHFLSSCCSSASAYASAFASASCNKYISFVPITIAVPIPNEEKFNFPKMKKKIYNRVQCARKPPLCSNCKHFIPFKSFTSFDEDQYGSGFGLCRMFGSKYDLIRYSFAKHCRENENQCGKNGYLYEDFDYCNRNQYIDHDEADDEDKNKNKNNEKGDHHNHKYEKYENHKEEKNSDKSNESNKNKDNDNDKDKSQEENIEYLKYTNSQLYDYSQFLNFSKNHSNKNDNE